MLVRDSTNVEYDCEWLKDMNTILDRAFTDMNEDISNLNQLQAIK